MARRKLNNRQKWRIEKIQQERTERAQRKETQISDKLQGGELGPEQQGVVIAHFGTQVEVEANEPDEQGQLISYRCFMRTNLGSLVAGDQVVFRMGNQSEGVVVATLPRKAILSRPNPYNEIKPVAANIDFIVLVVAVEPEVHTNLIDRYLVAAENCDIEPVILLNKCDLLTPEKEAFWKQRLAPYEALDYRTMRLSIKQSEGMKELVDMLNGHISAFVGQSGVGKSSIIQTLLPDEELRIGDLSHASKKGRHTTTTARLYHFPAGGDLIDSPGIREFGLWHMEPEEVLYGFRELRDYSGLCRFRDCQHQQEPGCALRAAIESGNISQQRFDSYQYILATLQEFGDGFGS